MDPNLLGGKKALVIGIANDNSIAYGCAQALKMAGADLAITYLNEKAKSFVDPAAKAFKPSKSLLKDPIALFAKNPDKIAILNCGDTKVNFLVASNCLLLTRRRVNKSFTLSIRAQIVQTSARSSIDAVPCGRSGISINFV